MVCYRKVSTLQERHTHYERCSLDLLTHNEFIKILIGASLSRPHTLTCIIIQAKFEENFKHLVQ